MSRCPSDFIEKFSERNALKDGRYDRSFLIKEADKGWGVVFVDIDFYETKL